MVKNMNTEKYREYKRLANKKWNKKYPQKHLAMLRKSYQKRKLSGKIRQEYEKSKIKKLQEALVSCAPIDLWHGIERGWGESGKKKKPGMAWAKEFIFHGKTRSEKAKEYHQKNRSRQRELRRIRRRLGRTDAEKLSRRMSNGIRVSLRGDKSRNHWEYLVGYTTADLKKHLESLWKTGMNWKNYGQYGWHIDHVIPKARLHIDGVDDPTFKFCWSLDNLQPMWWKENLLKSDKIAT